ncbi:protein phosphatase 2c domain-containing protein [Cystoisospora suis]|uniref:protein-serine/threonine phosphatase n=1 Tax=Cystoisospora suis TaxID=483139 RepID=A0A2C6KMG5_9APIC|nr:protein phosphatase 2c domain-containing protein [Cystoisospora suis]
MESSRGLRSSLPCCTLVCSFSGVLRLSFTFLASLAFLTAGTASSDVILSLSPALGVASRAAGPSGSSRVSQEASPSPSANVGLADSSAQDKETSIHALPTSLGVSGAASEPEVDNKGSSVSRGPGYKKRLETAQISQHDPVGPGSPASLLAALLTLVDNITEDGGHAVDKRERRSTLRGREKNTQGTATETRETSALFSGTEKLSSVPSHSRRLSAEEPLTGDVSGSSEGAETPTVDGAVPAGDNGVGQPSRVSGTTEPVVGQPGQRPSSETPTTEEAHSAIEFPSQKSAAGSTESRQTGGLDVEGAANKPVVVPNDPDRKDESLSEWPAESSAGGSAESDQAGGLGIEGESNDPVVVPNDPDREDESLSEWLAESSAGGSAESGQAGGLGIEGEANDPVAVPHDPDQEDESLSEWPAESSAGGSAESGQVGGPGILGEAKDPVVVSNDPDRENESLLEWLAESSAGGTAESGEAGGLGIEGEASDPVVVPDDPDREDESLSEWPAESSAGGSAESGQVGDPGILGEAKNPVVVPDDPDREDESLLEWLAESSAGNIAESEEAVHSGKEEGGTRFGAVVNDSARDGGTFPGSSAAGSVEDGTGAEEAVAATEEESADRGTVVNSTAGEDEILEGAVDEDDEEEDSHPVDDPKQKLFVQFEGGHARTVAATMVGRRPTDEDAIAVHVPLKHVPKAFLQAVFDGHGGSETAEFLAANVRKYFGSLKDLKPASITSACAALDKAIVELPEVGWSGSTGVLVFTELVEQPQEVTVAGREIVPQDDVANAFFPLEDLICQDEMTTALRTNKPVPPCVTPAGVERMTIGVDDILFKVTVANIGDSRALLLHSDGTYTRLSRDHKPNVPSEAARILTAGGFVDYTDTFRVNGVISLARAFGDREMKMNPDLSAEKQLLVAVPEVRSFYARTSDVLLVACDGLFEPDEMTHDFVARLLFAEIKRTPGPNYQSILKNLLDKAYELNSEDNISGLISTFSATSIAPHSQHFFVLSGTGEPIPERKRDFILSDDSFQETLLRDPAAVVNKSKFVDESSSDESMFDEDGASSEDAVDSVQGSSEGLEEDGGSR